MKTAFKWIKRGILTLLLLLVVVAVGGYFWLRTSLPQVDGSIAVPGLSAPVEIARDDRGVPTITAKSLNDAYFAVGFAHAQDRLFQMELMRRVGAGRLSEMIGRPGMSTDALMRTLGIYAQAEQQVKSASPGLKSALDAYAAGVNAFLAQRSGALPLEYQLLRTEPEPWRPADSLVWGRIMALQLSANWREEKLNLTLKKALPPDLFQILLPEAKPQAGLPAPWFGHINVASNNWVIGPEKSTTGAPVLANDPHLSLSAPSVWYLVHVVTPDRQWAGVTSPGMPLIVIGANESVAWGLTTTSGDTEDLFEEKPIDGNQNLYQTPEGSAPFETRFERIKIKNDGKPWGIEVRTTRHGPVISDLDKERKPTDPILALAAAFLQPDDRTADALYAMNMARNADEFRAALADFASPQQNVVFADRQGHFGFVAAGRVPVRRKVFANGLLPAPGWTGDYDWTGTLPFDQLPQSYDPAAGWIATANNKVVADDYPHFIAGRWFGDGRYQRIATLLQARPKFHVEDMEKIQLDTLSGPLRDLVQSWLPLVKDGDPVIIGMLQRWEGHADLDRAEPSIATLWVSLTANKLLRKKLGKSYDDWWFWNDEVLKELIRDPKACAPESCSALLGATLKEATDRLRAHFKVDAANWKWGALHRMHFRNPVLSNVPLLGDWLDPELATHGDMFTVNRAVPVEDTETLEMSDVHGPTMRIVVDLAMPMEAQVTLAGGQSGNPLSEHYADWLLDWRDGAYRSIVQPSVHTLTLKPGN
ncbi:penicillin acylase family protein [Dongia sp.]|uniref:penicillin acylase family protein n=1 Tax=Dongia sp. TaxID=1977262 RepID=UPI003751385B